MPLLQKDKNVVVQNAILGNIPEASSTNVATTQKDWDILNKERLKIKAF